MANWKNIQVGDNLRGKRISFSYPTSFSVLPSSEQTVYILKTAEPNSKYITGRDEIVPGMEEGGSYRIDTNILTEAIYTSRSIQNHYGWLDPSTSLPVQLKKEYTFDDSQDYIVEKVASYHNVMPEWYDEGQPSIKMFKGNEKKLTNLNIVDGQLIFTTDDKNIYLDSGDERKLFTQDANDSFVDKEEPTAANGDIWYVEEDVPTYNIKPFKDATEDEIAQYLDLHYAGKIDLSKYWNVGDEKIIHLNSIASPNKDTLINAWPEQDISIVITDFDHHNLKEKNQTRNRAALTLQTKQVINNIEGEYWDQEGCIYVDLSGHIDTQPLKWSELPMRAWMNNQFLTTCLSTKWQNMIKETKHKRLTTRTGKTTEEVIDKIFLPSYVEIFGNVAGFGYLGTTVPFPGLEGVEVIPNNEEGYQLEYFKNWEETATIFKYGNNNGQDNENMMMWWIGSASSNFNPNDYQWLGVSAGSATSSGDTAIGLAPMFCI